MLETPEPKKRMIGKNTPDWRFCSDKTRRNYYKECEQSLRDAIIEIFDAKPGNYLYLQMTSDKLNIRDNNISPKELKMINGSKFNIPQNEGQSHENSRDC